MNRMGTLVVVCLLLGGCLGESDDGGPAVPPPETEEPEVAPSCREVAGRCDRVCFGTCDGVESPGKCLGSCNGACCSEVP
jgi:hypothetical protein